MLLKFCRPTKNPLKINGLDDEKVELGGIEPPSGDATASAFYMFRVRLIFGIGPALP